MQIVEKSKDAATVGRVFGEPIHQGDVTVIPVAKVIQGSGGGKGSGEEEGGGVGFGLGAAPAGVFVIKDGDVRWQPVVDVNRIVIGSQIVAVVLLLTVRAVLKRHLKRRR